jgi:hypothetical protein
MISLPLRTNCCIVGITNLKFWDGEGRGKMMKRKRRRKKIYDFRSLLAYACRQNFLKGEIRDMSALTFFPVYF